MNSPAELAGRLLLRPGRPRPHNLASSRVDWAAVLTPGQPAASLPATLAALYAGCGHAHHWCAGRAVAAAQGEAVAPRGALPAALLRETLREHLRRITLDWPLAGGAMGAETGSLAAALGRCPLFADDEPHASLHWLEQHLLAMPAAHWLARWQHEPAGWLAHWSEQGATDTARWLAQCRPGASAPVAAATPLRVHADDGGLRVLAVQLMADAGFSRQPLWQGACAETGPGVRLLGPAAPPASAWLRFGARLAELLGLTLGRTEAGHAPPRLLCGSLHLGAGEGLAWVEMARGLLVHGVRLEGSGPQARIAACRVLAPTEWNFHPRGAVARRLERMGPVPTHAELQALGYLVAAYDPCVRFELEPARTPGPGSQQEQEDA